MTRIMNEEYYKSLIDGSDFGLIADYLISGRSPIYFLLHVQEREQLSKVAKAIDCHRADDPKSQPLLPEAVEEMMLNGSLKISPRFPMQIPNSAWRIDPFEIQRDAGCYVIYQPPFYVVHTPGLFEGLVYSEQHRERRQTQPPAFNFESQDHKQENQNPESQNQMGQPKRQGHSQ